MPTAKPWRFRQLGGQNKTLELRGYAAPFGRPRQKPVVTVHEKVRQIKRTYPGATAPTRHLSATMFEDLVLVGRWMDNFVDTDPDIGLGAKGLNGAKAKVREVQAFIRDQQRVVIEWGDMVGATGVLLELEVGWESEAQAAWTLTIGMDDDTTRIKTPPKVTLNSNADFLLSKIATDFAPILNTPNLLDQLQGLSNALVDLVDDQFSVVTGAFGQFVRAADEITSLEQAGEDELSRLRWGIGAVQTAVITLADLYDSIDKADESSAGGFLSIQSPATISAPWTSNENAKLKWDSFRLAQVVLMNSVLATMAELDAQAELAERGAASSMAFASDGDTWESLALALYNDVNQATTLRDANGARYGAAPQPGAIIVPPAQ